MQNQSSAIVLKTENLSIGYLKKKIATSIASNINIELNKGELVALVGANGVGKSTFLKTLTKLQKPLSGSVFISAKNTKLILPSEFAKKVSLVLTEPMANKHLTVYELIALGRQPYLNWIGKLTKIDINAIEQAIEQTNISHIKHKFCYELSDGQLQIVMIARAIAQQTPIIILDEPTVHLDLNHKANILNVLKQLVKTGGKTILFSSHEIDLVTQLCDKLMVMTTNKIDLDTPKNHIKKGSFNTLFSSDLIHFDHATGSFKIIN